MGKNSRRRKVERKQKRMEWEMEQQLKKNRIDQIPIDSSLIPASVAISPLFNELREYLTSENYKLIFASYNYDQCELHRLTNTSKSRALIQLFNRITKTNKSNMPTSGIIRNNVRNSGQYCSLFKTIPPDTELKEADFAGEGRVFFYLVQNYFCIVAIQVQHKNI